MANNITYFSTMAAFQEALISTARYRSERIALKHIDALDRQLLLNIREHINQLLEN